MPAGRATGRRCITTSWSKLHQTKKRVTEGLEELRYNTSIAALMELVNALRAETVCDKGIAEELVIMLAPFVPHFAEEAWERLGHTESVFEARWPAWDERLVVEDTNRGGGAGERKDAMEGAGAAGCG